ncbi:MAG: rhodanese-related sulfurtransferase [Acidimicrobiales bacterium]|jgi:rhodanese-related sulfurtransferase
MICKEVSLQEAWILLASTADAELIDVRTDAEWNYVGVPDLADIGKTTHLIEWNRFPGGENNERFVSQASERLTPHQPVLLLCRSGVRSLAAAGALAAAGFADLYNVSAGFEGDLDSAGHRHGGWKETLPWVQK